MPPGLSFSVCNKGQAAMPVPLIEARISSRRGEK